MGTPFFLEHTFSRPNFSGGGSCAGLGGGAITKKPGGELGLPLSGDSPTTILGAHLNSVQRASSEMNDRWRQRLSP